MNKEQFIATLQACYFGDKGAFNLILNEYEELHNKIDKAIESIEARIDGEFSLEPDYQADTFLVKVLSDIEEILKGDVDE